MLKSPAYFLLGVNAALFVVGMFIQTSAAICRARPHPTWRRGACFGIDPVHFGPIMVVTWRWSMITPFGVNLFTRPARWRAYSLDRHSATCAFVCVIWRADGHHPMPSLSLFLRDRVYARWQPPGGRRSASAL